jgi:hypothetical protein
MTFMSVCPYAYPPIAARQRLDKHVPAATNTNATEKEFFQELLVFSMQ